MIALMAAFISKYITIVQRWEKLELKAVFSGTRRPIKFSARKPFFPRHTVKITKTQLESVMRRMGIVSK